MIKEFPAEVRIVKVYCDKCGKAIDSYNTLLTNPPQYEYTCESCGNVQVEDFLPTYIVKSTGEVPACITADEE